MSVPGELAESGLESPGSAGVVLRIDEALHFALQLHRSSLLDDAEKLYRLILDSFPDSLDALHYFGFLCHQQERHAEAAELIARVVTLDPGNAEAHNNLGNTLQKLDRIEEAETCYRKAISLNTGFAPAFNNLGVLLMSRGNAAEALEAYSSAAELMPDEADFRYNMGNALRKSGRPDEAIAAYRKTIELDPKHFGAWQGLFRVFARENRQKEAAAVSAEWARLNSDSDFVGFLEAACLGGEAPSRAPNAYIEKVFDHMASDFDKHLKDRLDYQAPDLLMEALSDVIPPPARTLEILDAGCGTGLCGLLLRPYAKSLTGVDLSSTMLAKASARNIYDKLMKGELSEFLDLNAEAYDVIACSDTLCYFGALEPIFANAFKALRKGGLFAFTLELAEDGSSGSRLNPNCRYAHSKSYAEGALRAVGFAVRSTRTAVLRKEGGKPVAGQLIVAEKN